VGYAQTLREPVLDLEARRYQIALAHHVYGIVLVSEDGRVEFVNQQYCDMFGLDVAPSDLVGLTSPQFLRLVAPAYADPAEALALVRRILDANVEHLGDEVVTRSGRILLVDYTPIVVDGTPSGRMWSHRDITETKHAQEALRESEEKFSKAFQTSPYAISISRLEDGVFLEVNDAFVSMTGFSREELIGASAIDLGLWVHESDRVRVTRAAQEGRDMIGQEFLFRVKNGDLRTGLFSTQVLNLSGIPCLLSSVEDVTRRRQAEQELQRSRRLLSELIEHGAAAIFVKDREGRYELVNKKWEAVTGIRREDAIGRTDDELFPEPIAAEWRLLDLQVMDSLTELETEQTIQGPQGRRSFISSKFPIYEDDGTVHGVCGMVTDITARKEVEERIRHLATHDTLTDLPTLSLAKDRVTMALGMGRRQITSVGVMFVDLDGFKKVNDTHGHEAGDRVLQEMARRMVSCVRETDTVARVGGDEFLVVLTGLHSPEDAARVAAKMLSRMGEPVSLDGGHETSVGASIGIAMCSQCGEDPERLIKMADDAMYQVKNSGKNGYRFADPADV
jgi:diguanylate cyclase (GGDEF)-like protein/PAS domain S-box-containing protein